MFVADRRIDQKPPDPQNSGTGTEGCFNLLCLAPHAHDWWNRGLFALKPVDRSEDRTTLTCQFFWQPQYSHTRRSNVDLLMGPLLSRGLTRVNNYQLVHSEYCEDGLAQLTIIRSGDMFTLTTDDPDKKPLPSAQLQTARVTVDTTENYSNERG
jgi:HNH endonuclease